MSSVKRLATIASILLMLAGCGDQPITNTKDKIYKREHSLNNDWRFQLINNNDKFSYHQAAFDDSQWRSLNVPHDWSIEQSFDQQYNGATAYLPGGIGWYRKTFTSQQSMQNKQVYLYFDGVYANSEVWLNGKKLGGRINGYSPFYFDIASHLAPLNQSNTLAVKVNHENYIDSRWYTGSGIYRDVKLIVANKLHFPMWGTFITTPSITTKNATVNLDINLANNTPKQQTIQLVTSILNAQGEQIASQTSQHQIATTSQLTLSQQLNVQSPVLWQLDNPHLYQAKQQIWQDEQLIDEVSTTFGIRSIKFDANQGFFLNGKNIKIKGVNLHHDAGLVGTAVPDDVWRRRLLTLKEAGVNAIRTAHNPVSSNFLALCDELGFLVQAEIFDEWDNPKDKRLNQWERHDDAISRGYAEHFQTEAEHDLKDSILRDRNHPSIFMWSIGNEIEWTYPRYKPATGYFDMNASGNYFYNLPFISADEIYQRFHSSEEGQYVLANTAHKLSNWVKSLDTSRPVTANLILPSVSHISGYADALDVVGYSYRRVIYDYGHELYPDKVIMGTENVVQWHEWKAIEERDFISGTFLWTGIDYLGEAHNAWPRKATPSGMLDTAGFKKPSFHMYKTLWNDEPHIFITSQNQPKSLYTTKQTSGGELSVIEKEPGKWAQRVWVWQDVNRHWNYENNDLVIVEVLTNCPAVELFQNGKSLGIEKLSDHPDHILKWAVAFNQGELLAKGINGCSANDSIHTAKTATQISITSDKTTLSTNYNEVAHITLELRDENNNPVTHQAESIKIIVPDNIELLGLDSGNSSTIDRYQTNKVKTYQGRALAIIRAKDTQPAKIEVVLPNKQSTYVTIN